MAFEFLEHTADIKVKAWSDSLNDVFSEIVKAFSNYIGKGAKIKSSRKKIIEITGTDRKNLLYNFIDELIYLLDAEGFVVSKGRVVVKKNKIRAELFGDSSSKYNRLDHVKAATYAEMFIGKKKRQWEIVVVLDV